MTNDIKQAINKLIANASIQELLYGDDCTYCKDGGDLVSDGKNVFCSHCNKSAKKKYKINFKIERLNK